MYVTRRNPPNRSESLLLLGQENRGGDQLCELGDRALHHHQRALVHHQALELDSPVCQARLPRQLDKVSRLCCHLDTLALTVADPVVEADPVVVTVGDPLVVAGHLWVMQVGTTSHCRISVYFFEPKLSTILCVSLQMYNDLLRISLF